MGMICNSSSISGARKWLFAVFAGLLCIHLHAGPEDFFKGKGGKVDAAADRYEYVGDNVVATGHVVIQMQGMQFTADKAIVNHVSEDMEMAGNVTVQIQEITRKNVPLAEYEKMLQDPVIRVELEGYVTNPAGEQLVKVKVTSSSVYLKAERIAGNLKTGTIQFRNFAMKVGPLSCTGKYAERLFDGTFTVRDTKFTTCEYLQDDHDHYAIFAKKATISPRQANRGIFNYNADHSDHSLWTFNNFVEIYGVPVLWIPVLHKPRDLSSFGGYIEFGETSDWGYYYRTTKQFHLMDEPYLSANLMLDFYSERGFAYGVGLDFKTAESSTEMMFYGLRDWHPYQEWEDDDDKHKKWAINNSRLEIPHYRYEFRIANLTHLLPNLDFRGQLDIISDYNFLNDYFSSRYKSDLEPPSFASLEYQHERFTASAYSTFRVNSFATAVERLPELRLDFQRQELFGNFYYQGETSFDYLRMRWREFDRPRTNPKLGELQDYETGRFDSLHMLYYPINLLNINIIPRAGFRMTAYSRTSKKDITDKDLNDMFVIDMVDGQPTPKASAYDSKGGSKMRFATEIGVEANTKFYRSWQNVKNAYMNLDGLRHVVQPYLNYTYIPKTNLDRENIYYFDEIDRISEQNVIRLGLINRLQTRRNNQIQEIAYLENYWDCFFHKESGFDHIGDFGTVLRLNLFPGFTFTSDILLDMGQNNSHDSDVMRGKGNAGRPGLNWKYINRWYNSISYQIAPEWRIAASYEYSDDYIQRIPYSMGSTYSAISATDMFINRFERSQDLTFTLDFPSIIDKHLNGSFSLSYDVDAALMSDISLALKRRFHCIDVIAVGGLKTERDGKHKERDHYFSVFVSLSAMPQAGFGRGSD